jgi:mannose-6-phosphate isomerase-like protein (cupin superfamily)
MHEVVSNRFSFSRKIMAYANKEIRNAIAKMSLKFLQTSAGTDGGLLEIQATYDANLTMPVEHFHPMQDEYFTIISGELNVKMNGRVRILKAGDHLQIPRNTLHSMWNNSNDIAIVNWQVKPALNTEHFLEDAAGFAGINEINKKNKFSLLQSLWLVSRYDNEFRVAKPPRFIQRILFILLLPFAYWKGYGSVTKKFIG